jgi:hypothetical protein
VPLVLVWFAHEADTAYDWAAPMTPLWAQMRAWFLAALERANATTRMGVLLYPTFIAAGLLAPELRLECAVGGGDRAFAGAWPTLRGKLPALFIFRLHGSTSGVLQTSAYRAQLG